MIPALEVERYEELCRTVSIFLKPDDALDVLALMALAAPAIPDPPPVERAISRLATILDVDLRAPAAPRPFDWAAS